MRGRVDSANKMLGRLATKGVVKPLARGLWALGRDLDPKVLSRYLAAPSPSYVSLLSALRYHGMISQLPRATYVVTLGRPPAGGRSARRLRLREGEELDAQGAVEAPPDDRGAQDVRPRIGLMASRGTFTM